MTVRLPALVLLLVQTAGCNPDASEVESPPPEASLPAARVPGLAPDARAPWQVEYTPRGPAVRSAQAPGVLGEIELVGWGRQPRLAAPRPGELRHRPGGADYDRDDLLEWYVEHEGALQQGFTLRARPPDTAAGGPVVIEVRLAGLGRPVQSGEEIFLVSDAGLVFSYGGLSVSDAAGAPVAARLEARPDGVAIVIEDAEARYPLVVDPYLSFSAELLPAGTPASEDVATAVGVDGDVVALGAHNVPCPDGGGQCGVVYVFERSGTVWSQTATLRASDGGFYDQLGLSVDVSGDTIVAGAPHQHCLVDSECGAAYVFVKTGTSWTEQAKLVPSTRRPRTQFGFDVAIDGDRVVAGAPWDNVFYGREGIAYTFRRSGGTWTETDRLTASDGAVGDRLGYAVDVSGATAIAGADESDCAPGVGNCGAIYVFDDGPGGWSETAKLRPSDVGASALFGRGLSIDADVLASVGAEPLCTASLCGAIYVYRRTGGAWSQEAKLHVTDTVTPEWLGYSMAIHGDWMAVGASRSDCGAETDCGRAYFFHRAAATWENVALIVPPVPVAQGRFSTGLAMSASHVVAGQPSSTDVRTRGRAFVFRYGLTVLPPCSAGSDCASGFCVDGVCCDTACGGGRDDCMACSLEAGAAVEGTCGPLVGAAASLVTCRPAAGPCDVAETCAASSTACPADAYRRDGASCSDGLVCNGLEVCRAGVCEPGTAPVCDDGDPCTTDRCSEPAGCAADPIPACCSADTDCSDGDPCTADSCSPGMTCAYAPIAGCCAADTDCDDGDPCTDDACVARSCVSTPSPACADSGMPDAAMGDAGATDAGSDGGAGDAGPVLDASPDTAVPPADAGADAGLVDAGEPDAAVPQPDATPDAASADGSAGVDASVGPSSGGCGCGVADPRGSRRNGLLALLAVLLLGAPLRRERRRRMRGGS